MSDYSPSNVLLVFALESEAQDLFLDLNPVFSGVGKVNASYRLMKALSAWRHEKGKDPDLVLSLGSAGSTHFNFGEVVNCTRFIQRDFDTTDLGSQPYETPFEETSVCLENGIAFDGFSQGVCGSGDNFVTKGEACDWNLVDMEAYALAKICCCEKVPFACFKYITDGADDRAASLWKEKHGNSADNLRAVAERILRLSE